MLTSCDAFEHFPPPILKPFIAAAKSRTDVPARRSHRCGPGPAAPADTGRWLTPTSTSLPPSGSTPALSDRRVREDLRRFTASLNRADHGPRRERLPQFTKPALIAWSDDDVFFPLEDGRRLADALPNSRLEVIDNARTFSMIDQPDVLADLIADFARVEAKARAA